MKRATSFVALSVLLSLFSGLGGARAQERDREASGPQAAQSSDGTARAPSNAAASSRDSTDSMALVRIDGPAGAALQQEVDSVEHEWETVCKAPCLAYLSPAFQYRVSGAGLRPSQGFSLRVHEGEAEELHVNKAFLGLYVLGWVGVGAGSGVAGTGLIFGLWSAAANSLSLPPLTRNQALGWILLGGGAAGVVGGLVLVLTNKRTTVAQDVLGQPKAQEQGAVSPPQTPGPAPIQTAAAFLRTGPVFEVPIVSLSF